ncbi:hypothetical protein AAFG13_04790 [Bradyrhizobium sp. B124]
MTPNDPTVEQLYADIDATIARWEERSRGGTKTALPGFGIGS